MIDTLVIIAGILLSGGAIAFLFLWGLRRAMHDMYPDYSPPPKDERPPPPVRPGRR